MKDPEKDFQIFVNTKPRKVPGPSISFEQVLAEAGLNTAGQDLNNPKIQLSTWYNNRGQVIQINLDIHSMSELQKMLEPITVFSQEFKNSIDIRPEKCRGFKWR